MKHKSELAKALRDPQSRWFYVTNDVLAFFTIISVVAIVLETVPALTKYQYIFDGIEYVVVVVFTVEYVTRWVVTKPGWRYPLSFLGIIDLLAILPTYLGLTNLTFLKTARVVRILSFLRMVRLAKLRHLSRRDPDEQLSVYRLNVALYFVSLAGATLLFGNLLYLVEAEAGTYASIPAAMLWTIETFLGGSVTATELPKTVLGEIIGILTRFSGLVLLGLLLTVIGSSVQKLIFGKTI